MKRLLTSLVLLFCLTAAFAVDFTLHNSTGKSIPLIIPGVMKPNLSPNSDSGVDLAVGQEVFFRYKGKKRLPLEVTADLEGKRLDVAELIKERRKALDAS